MCDVDVKTSTEMQLSFCCLRRLRETVDLKLPRWLSSSSFHHKRKQLVEVGHEVGVGERLVQNIIRAGLRVLKGDRRALERNVRDREVDIDLQKLCEFKSRYDDISHRIELLRQMRNVNIHTTTIGVVKEGGAVTEYIDKGRQIKHELTELEHERYDIEQEMYPLLSLLPNTSHPDTPIGGYDDIKIVHTHGNKPEFDFPIHDHVELGEALELIDFSSAAECSGRRFYYLQGAAVFLEQALVQYALNKAVNKGYSPVTTPDIIRTGVVEGCGFHPRGEATQVYSLDRHHGDLSLSGTAEVPLAGMFIGKTLSSSDLPIKLVAVGRCYRAESGGAGHAVRGLYRVHQFTKVELFIVTEGGMGEEESGEELERMVAFQEEICRDLGLHYRVLEMPTGELGSPAHRKYDIEVWMPGRGEYGEVTSASNCTSYQSQRLGIRTRPGLSGKTSFAHTLNATACAIPRLIIALLENYQLKDGSVVVPAVLHPFLPKYYHHIT